MRKSNLVDCEGNKIDEKLQERKKNLNKTKPIISNRKFKNKFATFSPLALNDGSLE